MKNRKYGIAIMALMLVVISSINAQAAEQQSYRNTIPKGIKIGTIDVSGMTRKEAKSAINDSMKIDLHKKVIVSVGGSAVSTTVEELGYGWINEGVVKDAYDLAKSGNSISRYKERIDIEKENKTYDLTLGVDTEVLAKEVSEKCMLFNKPAKDATLVKVSGGFNITPEQKGLLIDEEATVSKINEMLTKWNGEELKIEAVTKVDVPKVTKEDCEKVDSTPMASFATKFGTGSYNYNRNKNIENGAKLLNGIVLAPDEVCKVLELVEPFTSENGYYEAGTFENGKVSTGMGGGICQVTTTMYNALLLSELEIVLRHNHSMTVSYVPLAADAAIAEGYKDLQFKNNTDYVVYIEGWTDINTGDVGFNIYGHDTREEGRTIEYKSETIDTKEPEVKETEDPDKPEGYKKIVTKGYIGYTAKLWKYVYQDGKEISKELVNSSTYRATPTEVIVGTGENTKGIEVVTDKNGEPVTDENGEPITAKKKDEEDTKKKKSKKKNNKETGYKGQQSASE